MKAQSPQSFKTISSVVLFLTIIFWAFFDISKKAAVFAVINPFAEDPYDAVGSFGIQLAFVVALLSLIRALRPYPSKETPPAQRLLIARGETVVLLAIAVTLAADIVAMLRYPLMWRESPGGWILLGLMGVVIFLAVLAGLWLHRYARNYLVSSANRSWARLIILPASLLILAVYPEGLQDSIPGGILSALLGMALLFICTWVFATVLFPPVEMKFEDVLDDIAAIYQAVKFRRGVISPSGSLTKISWLPRSFDWLNPRQHKWHLVILAAVGMGGILLLAEAINEGLSTNMNIALLVIAVFVGIEGLGVILGYLLFGEFLGIFRKE